MASRSRGQRKNASRSNQPAKSRGVSVIAQKRGSTSQDSEDAPLSKVQVSQSANKKSPPIEREESGATEANEIVASKKGAHIPGDGNKSQKMQVENINMQDVVVNDDSYAYLKVSDDGTRCICRGLESSELMGCCEECESWQHFACEFGSENFELPEPYFCFICSATRRPQRLLLYQSLKEHLIKNCNEKKADKIARTMEMYHFMKHRTKNPRLYVGAKYTQTMNNLVLYLGICSTLRENVVDGLISPKKYMSMSVAELKQYVNKKPELKSDHEPVSTASIENRSGEIGSAQHSDIETSASVSESGSAVEHPKPTIEEADKEKNVEMLSETNPEIEESEQENIHENKSKRKEPETNSTEEVENGNADLKKKGTGKRETKEIQKAVRVRTSNEKRDKPSSVNNSEETTNHESIVLNPSSETEQNNQNSANLEIPSEEKSLEEAAGQPHRSATLISTPETNPASTQILDHGKPWDKEGSLQSSEAIESHMTLVDKSKRGQEALSIDSDTPESVMLADVDHSVAGVVPESQAKPEEMHIRVETKSLPSFDAIMTRVSTPSNKPMPKTINVMGITPYDSLQRYCQKIRSSRKHSYVLDVYSLRSANSGRLIAFLCHRDRAGVCVPNDDIRTIHIVPAHKAYEYDLTDAVDLDALLFAIVVRRP
ncbi:hypothetical protein DASB73_021040 [Starmerella bacillaris]|uniref:Zinc finger PHD-type domain-containing protein n=1 Tax=Starmerella bacillaris TaxID=1247836 RepID=A0AAV5RKK0_STABA|nr:hypothetical protein DASB73_021040 [Starmerella bacillaris]